MIILKNMNISKIIEAWVIAKNPNKQQRKLAEERIEICNVCPSQKEIILHVCTECGCPISKKVFTNSFNPCPLKKWEEVDNEFYFEKSRKTLL